MLSFNSTKLCTFILSHYYYYSRVVITISKKKNTTIFFYKGLKKYKHLNIGCVCLQQFSELPLEFPILEWLGDTKSRSEEVFFNHKNIQKGEFSMFSVIKFKKGGHPTYEIHSLKYCLWWTVFFLNHCALISSAYESYFPMYS